MSATQAAEVTSAAREAPGAEAELLAAARATKVKGLRDKAREVRAGAREDDEQWAEELHRTRRAHEWHDPDSAYRMEARMAPDDGARFSAAWNAHIDRIFGEARKAGRHEPRPRTPPTLSWRWRPTGRASPFSSECGRCRADRAPSRRTR